MKKEKAFSKGGFYPFVLKNNLMLHKNVAQAGTAVLRDWLLTFVSDSPVRVLDLACGGSPVSICEMIAGSVSHQFEYTGVDINPDQIDLAKSFSFPANIVSVDLLEGNAWDLVSAGLKDEYDFVFTGMNLHHGISEEIFCVLCQIKERLAPGGLYMNHDVYRPEGAAYVRRPDSNPTNPTESFRMIGADILTNFKMPMTVVRPGDGRSDWRQPFVQRYRVAMRELGADEDGIDEVIGHVLARDYPLSVPEMCSLAGEAGLPLRQVDLRAANEPLKEYFCLVAAVAS